MANMHPCSIKNALNNTYNIYIQTTTKVHITQTYIYYFHALVAFPVPRFNGFVVAEFCVFLAGLSGFRTVASASSESLVKVLLLGRLVSSDKYFLERLLFAVASGSICSVIS